MTKNTNTFQDLLDITDPKLHPIVKKLREIILEIHPDAYEIVQLGYRSITFAVGPKKMSDGHTYIITHKSWVNLGFYYGVKLNDKSNILEGTGKNMRHIKIHSIEEINSKEIKELIILAVEERIKYFNQYF